MSNALDMSRAVAMVLWGGGFWLNPLVIILFMVCSAVVVECVCVCVHVCVCARAHCGVHCGVLMCMCVRVHLRGSTLPIFRFLCL